MAAVKIVIGDDGKPVAQLLDDAGKVTGTAAVQLPEGHTIEDVGSLRRAYESEKDSRKKLAEQVRKFEGIDDPDAARSALENVKAGAVKTTKEIEEFRAQVEKKFAADRAALEARLAQRDAEVHQLTFGAEAAQAIAKFKGNPTFLMPVLEKRARYTRDENGQIVRRILDDHGREMVTRKSGSTDPMGLEEFVAILAEDKTYAPVFEGRGVAGAGTTAHQKPSSASDSPSGGGQYLDPEADLVNIFKAKG